MEKRGVIEPGRTPATDRVKNEKRAGSPREQVESLDDDFTKRAAETAADSLNKRGK